jgi:16S rRNA (guanine527-N7)-methyltransferase
MFGADDFQKATGVSRETMERLETYEALLNDRGAVTNLVARSTLPHFWHRHALDSAQLVDLAPSEAVRWVDIGSGAGFPGLVVATLIAGRAGASVRLIESTAKKAAFLAEVATVLDLPVQIVNERIEAVPAIAADVLTARALAPMLRLTPWIKPYVDKGARALLLKGQDLASELTETARYWKLTSKQHPSVTDPRGVVLEVTGVQHERPARTGHRHR